MADNSLTSTLQLFQSQTGSPSSSDSGAQDLLSRGRRFNPKREAHPLQTVHIDRRAVRNCAFQSQTGSPSSSDEAAAVSRAISCSFNPKREAHPLQTGDCVRGAGEIICVSIPNGKPILFRLSDASVTDEISNSFNPKREAHPLQTLRARASS